MPSRLRIATFNLEDLGADGHGAPPFAERVAALRPLLTRLDADILCLQEVNAQELAAHQGRALTALDRVLEGTPYAGYQRTASIGPSGEHPADKHNLVLLSRLPIAESRQVRHELLPAVPYSPVTARPLGTAPMAIRFDRPFLYAAVQLPTGRRLHVLNLHLKAPLAAAIAGQKESAFVWKTVAGWAEGFFLASLKRAGQALEVRLFVEQIFDVEPDALIVVCGDYNAEVREVPVRLILGNVDDTGNSHLAPRALSALDDRLPPEGRYSVLHDGRRVMLDHLLVSNPLAALCGGMAAFNEGLADEALSFAAGVRTPGSFHAPLVAEFRLPD